MTWENNGLIINNRSSMLIFFYNNNNSIKMVNTQYELSKHKTRSLGPRLCIIGQFLLFFLRICVLIGILDLVKTRRNA